MGVLIALCAAVTYGAGDFFGGLAAKRESVLTVVPISGVFGLATALAATRLLSPGPPPPGDLALGALTGAIGGVAIACLYRGLAVGRMSVVAPITAVIAAIVPVAFGVFVGERPSAGVVVGIVVALVAVALVSSSNDRDVSGALEPRRSGIAEALAAGIGFGMLYVVLSQTSRGMWPLVAARTVSVALVGAVALVMGRLKAPSRSSLATIAGSGFLDMIGNVLYVVSLRYAMISVAAVVTSLYPASTVVLARLVLHERLGRVQWVGVGCAAAGIALIARG